MAGFFTPFEKLVDAIVILTLQLAAFPFEIILS